MNKKQTYMYFRLSISGFYSTTSMARTSFGRYEFVLDMDSSTH